MNSLRESLKLSMPLEMSWVLDLAVSAESDGHGGRATATVPGHKVASF